MSSFADTGAQERSPDLGASLISVSAWLNVVLRRGESRDLTDKICMPASSWGNEVGRKSEGGRHALEGSRGEGGAEGQDGGGSLNDYRYLLG